MGRCYTGFHTGFLNSTHPPPFRDTGLGLLVVGLRGVLRRLSVSETIHETLFEKMYYPTGFETNTHSLRIGGLGTVRRLRFR